ncbi:MAG: DUF6491 family protein [Rhodanobacter sp.]
MKSPAFIALLALAAAATAASAAPPPRTPLPAAECIQPSRINDWHIVDDRTATVRSGPKYYQVILQTACPQLRHPPGLIFRANAANTSANGGRICGEVGESVRSQGQAPCAIERIQRIDKTRFDQLNATPKP